MENAIRQAMKAQGLAKATDVIVSGGSAGGLATYLHVDEIAELFPRARVSGLPDSGYFIDIPDVDGVRHIRNQFKYAYKMQNASYGVNKDCVQAYAYGSNDPDMSWPCFMAQYTYPYIKTTTFIQNPLADVWQLIFIVAPYLNPINYWWGCDLGGGMKGCNTSQLSAVQTLYDSMLTSLTLNNIKAGYLSSCITHVIGVQPFTWNGTQISGVTQIEALEEWYSNSTWKYGALYDAPPPYGCRPI
jgi:hypothetical protein